MPVALRPGQVATLALQDGRTFRGVAFGATTTVIGEVVFNTSLTGYQEILSDPSYDGQIVCLTAVEIGNVGVNVDDDESESHGAAGLVVRALSPVASNWRARGDLSGWLTARRMPGIAELDTRALTRHLRERGSVMGAISTDGTPAETLIQTLRRAPTMDGLDLASGVSTRASYSWDIPSWGHQTPPPIDLHVVAYDFGLKRNILQRLRDQGIRTTVVPSKTSIDEAMRLRPDGIFLSNGPGDPAALTDVVDQIRKLLIQYPKMPVFGICLGHQILCLALGGRTFKLKFGHHGGNHPVLETATGRVAITAQNHGFAADPESLPEGVEVTHINLFDHTVAGLRVQGRPISSVQYHPEASPGPHDSEALFAEFARSLRAQRVAS